MAPKTTTLGASGPTVNALGIGLMSLGHAYGDAGDDETRLAFLDKLWEMGETFWDDADIYGDSEELVGKWFTLHPERRKDIFLATKFGFVSVDPTKAMEIRSDPEYIREAMEKSLKKLKTDYVDLYYCHRVDEKTPIEHTVKAMAELKQQGKIHHIGLSEIVPNDLRRACKVHHIAAVETEYSPWALEPEDGLLEVCRELGVALIAYSPLGRGFLTGQIRSPEDVKGDARQYFPRFYPENFEKNFDVVKKLEAIAEKKGVKSGQLGLAWLIKQGKGTTVLPIFGTRTAGRVKENMAAETVELTDAEEKEIRDVVDKATGEGHFGDRYPQMMQHLQLRETVPLKE